LTVNSALGRGIVTKMDAEVTENACHRQHALSEEKPAPPVFDIIYIMRSMLAIIYLTKVR
jgi:hypothetical protein